jgi:hypothetical protein
MQSVGSRSKSSAAASSPSCAIAGSIVRDPNKAAAHFNLVHVIASPALGKPVTP